MIALIKAELRKLLTVRSTYLMMALALAIVLLVGFYIEGWRSSPEGLASSLKLASAVTGAVGAVVIFAALIGVLLMTHEYRYNTIAYTLTGANSRSKVLLAKILVVTLFALVFTAVFAVLAPLVTLLGIHMSGHGHQLAPQTFYYVDLAWRSLFYGWGYSMVALLIAVLVRNQIGAIVTLLIVPGTVETVLGLLLKKNVVYLPFTTLANVVGSVPGSTISPAKSALIFSAYLVVGWAVAWYLFVRRDAN